MRNHILIAILSITLSVGCGWISDKIKETAVEKGKVAITSEVEEKSVELRRIP